MYWRAGGKIVWRSLKVRTRTEAERLHDLYFEAIRVKRAETALRRDFPVPLTTALPLSSVALAKEDAPSPLTSEPRRQRLRLSAMWDLALSRRSLSETHRILWGLFLRRCGMTYADQVTSQAALAYLEAHYSGGNGKTWNNTRAALNTIFRLCLVESGLAASPFQLVPQRRVEEVETHRNLTAEEFSRLFAAAPPQLQVLLMLSRWTTQRLETCARMTPEMFSFADLVFIIDPGKTRRFRKWVCCPIFPELEKYIRPLLPQCQPGRPIASNFGRLSNKKASEKCRELCRELGILDTAAGKASFHSVRGTAITWLKEHGIRGEELRSITGHTSTSVEDIYARDTATLAAIARKFRAAEKGPSHV